MPVLRVHLRRLRPRLRGSGLRPRQNGWRTLTPDGSLTTPELCVLIEESYRAVAPKTLLEELDARAAAPQPTPVEPSARRKG